MIVSILRILAFQALLVVVAMIECTVAVPFVTILLFLLQSRSFSTTAFYIYVSMVSLVLAVVMMQSWLLIFLVLTVGGITLRSNVFYMQTSFMKALLLTALMAIVISLFARPLLSTAYIFHSLLSFLVALAISYRWFSLKEKKLRWKDIHFGGNQ